MKTCSTPNCNKIVLAKNLCCKCYYRIKRGGTPELSKKQQMALRKCSVKDCTKAHFSSDLCDMHYRRLQRHGDPNYINPKCNRDGKTKERRTKYYNDWLKANWPNQKAYRAARKKRVKQATPPWSDINAITVFYANCPVGYHVDHIIPLFGEIVSGLHTIENLQYLPALENLKKGNKFIT